MYANATKKVTEAHKQLQSMGLELKVQSLRKHHETQFFLYNVENFVLCGDVSLDRTQNIPVDNYLLESDQVIKVDDKDVKCEQIGQVKTMSNDARARLVMRLHFLVHSYINMYVWCPESKQEVVGYRMTERSQATKQSHLLTIDKLVCEMPLSKAFDDNQTADSNHDLMKQYGPNEGILISDIDDFMPRGNPIVNFKSEWPPVEEQSKS